MVERAAPSIRTALVLLILAASARAADAAPDFYGVKMKSEDFARNVFLIDRHKVPDFTNNRPGTDKRVYAYAYMSSTLGGGRGIAIEVFNHAEGPIKTDRLFRELTVVMYDGRRYDRAETEMMWSRDRLESGEHATFNYSFPGVRVDKEEIRMVICSFEMGETLIFLFPLSSPEQMAQAEKQRVESADGSPQPPAPAGKKTVKKVVKKQAVQTKGSPKTLMEHCVTPVRLVQSIFSAFGQRLAGKDPHDHGRTEEVEYEEVVEVTETAPEAAASPGPPAQRPDQERTPDFPLVKAEQVIDGVHYHFGPEYRKEVQRSQEDVENKIHRDRPWSMENPDKLVTHEERTVLSSTGLPRNEARVVIANLEYGFIVVDAGLQDGFGKNVILSVYRDGRRIAKAMVTKPRDDKAGAIILPEWRTRDEIRVGDIVGVSQ